MPTKNCGTQKTNEKCSTHDSSRLPSSNISAAMLTDASQQHTTTPRRNGTDDLRSQISSNPDQLQSGAFYRASWSGWRAIRAAIAPAISGLDDYRARVKSPSID